MADNFDAVDIMQEILGASISGSVVHKDRATKDENGESYIVVNSPACNSLDVVNVAQVNINVYVKKFKDGTRNRAEFKTLQSAIDNLIENAASPEGYYCRIDRVFSGPVEGGREHYDCHTTRYELTLNQ